MNAILMALTTAVVLSGAAPQRPAQAAAAQRPSMSVSASAITIQRGLVTLIEDVKVPAEEAGRLLEFKVREGDAVKAGQLLAQLDDSQVQKTEQVAAFKWQAAKVEAENDVNVRYAAATRDVAQADLEKSMETNRRVPNTVTETEMRKLWLDLQKSKLGIEQAQHDRQVAVLTVDVRAAEHSLEKINLERRQIKAPTDGMIVKRFVRAGEWVKPGDPVLHLVRMDKLWVEGFIDAAGANGVTPGEVDRKPVTVTVLLPRGRVETFQGQVVLASPMIEAGSQFLVRAEVGNRQNGSHWLLLPGTEAQISIDLNR